MSERRPTASEVIKTLEAKLSHASELADDVFRLLEQISEIETEARDYASRSLGLDHGASAFDLALVSCPALKRLKDRPESFSRGIVASPETRQSPVATGPAAAPVAAPRAADIAILNGIEVPASRIEEARAIIDEAATHRRNGGTVNLYANNRGKNAWRRSLFKAAMDAPLAAAVPSAVPAPQPVVEEAAAILRPTVFAPLQPPAPPPVVIAPDIRPEPVPPVETPSGFAPSTEQAWEADPLDDPIETDSARITHSEPDAVPPQSQRLPIRRPSYGNSNPKPDGLAEAIQSMRESGKDPSVPSTPSASIRFKQPHFLRRGKTS